MGRYRPLAIQCLKALGQQQQEVLVKAGKDAQAYFEGKADAVNNEAVKDFKDHNVKVVTLSEKGAIEIAPPAYMRGRTLNDAFIILDEAQNTTSEQMKMFLTRLGFGSKAVVTGDITQIDLPTARMSGLVEALKIVKDVEGIGFVYFDDRDVVRHKLVQQIVKAYEAFGNGGQPGPARVPEE